MLAENVQQFAMKTPNECSFGIIPFHSSSNGEEVQGEHIENGEV
jgi:hypothetical protein